MAMATRRKFMAGAVGASSTPSVQIGASPCPLGHIKGQQELGIPAVFVKHWESEQYGNNLGSIPSLALFLCGKCGVLYARQGKR